MSVEGRGQLLTDPSGTTTIEVEVYATASSVWRVAITVAVFLGLTWYNLVFLDNKLAYILPIFAAFLVLVSWLQVQSLTERVWPGVQIAVRRLLSDQSNE